jgi:hypothetical protein
VAVAPWIARSHQPRVTMKSKQAIAEHLSACTPAGANAAMAGDIAKRCPKRPCSS